MSIIYSYPIKGAAVDGDLILISDSASTPKFATKQVKVSGLPFSNNQGTVTSVGLSMPSAFEVGNSPVTSSGTISVATVGGNSGQFLAYDGTWRTPAGGAANPAGAVSQIQYHDTGGVFGASPDFSYASSVLRVKHTINVLGQGNLLPAGRIKLHCENSSHGVTLEGPAHAGNNSYLLKLPSASPTNNQILEYTTAGSLGWIATPSGGGGSYTAGDGLDLNGTVFSAGRLTNGGLTINGGKLQVKLNDTDMSGELRAVDGGTGLSAYGVGDLLYAETAYTLAQITLGANDKILGVNNGATAPQWITNLVGQEVTTGHMLIGAGTSAMTAIDTTAKGTIAVGNGTTTATLAVGTNDHVLTARSSAATGAAWLKMETSRISDYEIGSWTPAPFAATGSAPSTGTCIGYYERIGDIVIVHFYLPIAGSSANNVSMMIGGLPYTGQSGNGYLGGVSLYANNGTTYIQQQAVSGMVNGANISLYRFTSTTDYDYTAASWYAPGALNYTIAGTATYRKA